MPINIEMSLLSIRNISVPGSIENQDAGTELFVMLYDIFIYVIHYSLLFYYSFYLVHCTVYENLKYVHKLHKLHRLS